MNNITSLYCCCIVQMQQQYSCRHWLIWFKGETTTMQSIDLPLTLALDSLFTSLSSFTLKVVLVLSKVSHSDWVDMCLDSLNNKVCKGLDLLVGGIVFEQHRCFNFSVQVLIFRIQIVCGILKPVLYITGPTSFHEKTLAVWFRPSGD